MGAVPGRGRRARLRDWAELLRVSALFTVPGDALAGAAATGLRANRGTAYAVGASLCLYEAGMALNDWADRDEDAVERPHRPVPSGRISPTAALGAAGLLTAAGLTFAARAGRPALAVASALTATVWAYDLRLKHTPAAPAAMAAARALDLVLGATATMSAAAREGQGSGRGLALMSRQDQRTGPNRPSGPGLPSVSDAALRTASPALALAAHTYAVTAVSRHETHGGSPLTPLAALGATTTLGLLLARTRATTTGIFPALTAAAYVRTTALPCLHAALNPSPPLTQRAVGSGIRALIPLQATLAARSGANVTALAVLGLVPMARALARKVSPT
ncbi:UbiA family prenyltransferase [Streptomyces muensis]|uniref:UbiA family prenyltransferase n=1 Tax=Streptomyces muensis TaxID=1077944 RepID=A0A9X1PZZ6_STRM4|nr:UbiA family prenyltransferase [Streptomyces muensis]MCF1596685.1 UbiA family prenyltransferase [Streptomyces muensis]